MSAFQLTNLFMLFLFGVPVLVGIMLVWYGRRAGPGGSGPACGGCGYNLTGAPENRCPECGRLFIEAGVLVGPSRRGRRRMTVVGVSLILAPLLLFGGLTVFMTVQRQAIMAQVQAASAQARAQAQAAQAAEQAGLETVAAQAKGTSQQARSEQE